MSFDTQITTTVEADVDLKLWSVRDKSNSEVPVDEFWADEDNDLRISLSVDMVSTENQKILDYLERKQITYKELVARYG